MSKEPVTRTSLDRYADLFMGFGFVILLLAATGWLVDEPVLASFNSAYVPMAPATLMLFLGIWGTWFIRRVFPASEGLRRIIQAIQLGLLILVLLLGIRSITGLGADLEKFVIPHLPMFGQVSSARMSPLTVLGFMLALPALFLLTRRVPGKRTKSISAAFALVVFVLNGVIIIGYLYGAPFFYGGTTIPVALTTAGAFLFLSLGLMLMAGPDCWPVRMYIGHSLKERLMRVFIPLTIIIVLFHDLLETAVDPWILNPGLKVAIEAIGVSLIAMLIVSLLIDNVSRDIERGRQAELELLQSESKLYALFSSMQDVVIVYDMDGRYLEIAPTNQANFYRPSHDMLGRTLHEILPKEQADYNLSMLRQAIQTGKTVNGEYALQIGGGERWFSASISRLSETTAIFVAHDVTNRKHLEQEILSLSLSDELTGLYNRRGFNLLAEQEMKRVRRFKRSVLLYFCDVDGLKLINDTHGHDQGDQALKEISAVLKETFRETDILARFGGDEFVVLAVDAALESVEPLTNRLQSRLDKWNQGDNRLYQLSLSLGIARYDPGAPCTLTELIARADGRMYEQKRARQEHQGLLPQLP